MQVSPITMSLPFPRSTTLPCLPLAVKDSLKEHMGLFVLGLFALGAFAFEFLVCKAFGREENC
jgi:hypothetical protein